MATPMPPVTGNVNIASAQFVSLQLGDTTYRFSDAYETITVDGEQYTDLGHMLMISDFTYNYKSTQGTSQIMISGVPSDPNYMNIVQSTPIRGGDIEIRRVFFDPDTLEPLAGEEYLRFKGIISNYIIEEQDTDFFTGVSTNVITFEAASVYAVLSKKISGQRTNGSERRKFYPGDPSFDRVKEVLILPEFDR